MSVNSLSINKLTKSQNRSVTLFLNQCVFQDLAMEKMIDSAKGREGLYYLIPQDWAYQMEGSLAREHEIRLQHERILGHLNFGPLRIYPDLFKGFDSSFLKFEICELAKSHHVPYSLRNNKCDFPFFFSYSHRYMGPSRVTSMSRTRWFINFIDDCIRVTWIYLMREKSDAIGTFQKFHKMISVKFDAKVKVIRSDNRGEHFNGSLSMFLTNNGINDTSHHAQIHLSKMVLLRVRIDIFWRLLGHFSLLGVSQRFIGVMLF